MKSQEVVAGIFIREVERRKEVLLVCDSEGGPWYFPRAEIDDWRDASDVLRSRFGHLFDGVPPRNYVHKTGNSGVKHKPVSVNYYIVERAQGESVSGFAKYQWCQKPKQLNLTSFAREVVDDLLIDGFLR